MKTPAGVILKRGKEKAVRQRHHWIFSGAIQSAPDFADGDILSVYSAGGERLGEAYFHHHTSIAGRMLSFGESDAHAALRERIRDAIRLRRGFFSADETNAYRMIHAEGDCLPGLVVDRYADVLVLQAMTVGMERLKPVVVEVLRQELAPRTIYEKSRGPSLKEERLAEREGVLFGQNVDVVEMIECGKKFLVSVRAGQKTGFFLDQREMRRLVAEMAKGRRVLNCFGYTGGFSVSALSGGAAQAETVDQDETAIALARQNLTLNGFSPQENPCTVGDVFLFLRELPRGRHDLIVLDPPAFAKKKSDVAAACRGYKDINRLAIEKIAPGGIIVTSSCSYHMEERLFQMVVFQAALDAGRAVRILGRHRQAADHPINVYHPEGEYLKSLVLSVE